MKILTITGSILATFIFILGLIGKAYHFCYIGLMLYHSFLLSSILESINKK